MSTFNLLFELGTEELPPKALLPLSEALHDDLLQRLAALNLSYGKVTPFAAPRRLALLIEDLADREPDREAVRRGPAHKAAFDAEGNPTRALSGFARSCGVEVSALETLETDKGSWMVYPHKITGRETRALLPELIEQTLDALPIAKRMRWGSQRQSFVRPVHWVVLMADDEVIPGQIMGMNTDRKTFGHRFHHPEAIALNNVSEYEQVLHETGQVQASFSSRRQWIREQVTECAARIGARAVIEDELLDEVTALVEWPVALMGSFEEHFLKVPAEALISTMKENQKYFHLVNSEGRLLARFITVSNLVSNEPLTVIEGNQRVIRPRLADAEFFYETDLKLSQEQRLEALDKIIFQKELGTLKARAERLADLSERIARALGEDPAQAHRAGRLAKTDLVSGLVTEFPELQGIAGRYYALAAGEPAGVASAIEDHYRPRFSGDELPSDRLGQVVALAEKLDLLVGIFGINQKPTGTRDPFALRRAALGVIRLVIECSVDLNLKDLVGWSMERYTVSLPNPNTEKEVTDYILERLKAWYEDRNVSHETFQSVLARRPTNLIDFQKRIEGVEHFQALPAAQSLIAANKRVSNLLSKTNQSPDTVINLDQTLCETEAERELISRLESLEEKVSIHISSRDYAGAMQELAALKEPIDDFFEHVMVNVEDKTLRLHRLGLLQRARQLFLNVADVSLMASGK